MENTFCVGSGQTICQLLGVSKNFADVEWPSEKFLAQSLARKQLRNHKRDAVAYLPAVNDWDAGVVDRGENTCFLFEARKEFGIFAEASGRIFIATSRIK